MNEEEKEDFGLLILMRKVDRTETVSEDEVMNVLKNIK